MLLHVYRSCTTFGSPLAGEGPRQFDMQFGLKEVRLCVWH